MMNFEVDHTGDQQRVKDDQRSPHHVLVLTYWAFNDALIQSYTLPYVRIMRDQLPPGSVVHLVTLEKEGRSPVRFEEPGIVLHPFRYRPFGWRALGMMLGLVWRCCMLVWHFRIGTVHAWCTPAGMIGHLVSVITRRPLVLDSYEPHAESMVENGTWTKGGSAFRILFHFERAQSARARTVIATTVGMRKYALSRYGVELKNMQVKPACVDLDRFSYRNVKVPELLRVSGLENKLVAVYAGKFGGIYLDQEVFDLLRVAKDHWGERFHVLLLTGHSRQELEPYMLKAGLSADLFTVKYVRPEEVPDHMGLADFALTPVKTVPTKRYCTPIKDGEYWALGLPVLITPDISDDSAIIQEYGIGSVLSGLDAAAYLRSIKEIDALLQGNSRKELYDRIRPIAERYRSFSLAQEVYASIYGRS